MRLDFFHMIEFNNIKARLQEIYEGDYLDKSYGNLGEASQRISTLMDMDMKIFMGPLQIQE